MGHGAALDAFWQEMTAHGTPLVEPIPGDEHHRLVTFIWRGSHDLRNVVVLDGIAGDNFASNQLTQLPGTDLFFKSYRARKDTHTVYSFSTNDPLLSEEDEGWAEHYSSVFCMDPLNPHTLFGEESVLRLPDALRELWIEARPGVPAGQVVQYLFHSDLLNNERDIWIYTPPGYNPLKGAYAWMLLFDGRAHLNLPAPTILDNLIAENRIPALVVVFVANAEGARTRELTCSPAFAECICQELLPWVRERYPISPDPQQAIIGGFSYGALAAAFTALRCPQVFGKVLAQSGSYWWGPGYDDRKILPEDGEQDWLIHQFVKADRRRLRFYLSAGLLETGCPPGGILTSTLAANRHFRDVLEAKGYLVGYQEYSGGHDLIGWRGVFPEAVVTLSSA